MKVSKMGLSCGATLVKYLLCLLNFFFFFGGMVVLCVGIWLAADQNSFITLMRLTEQEALQQYSQPPVIEQGAYILISAGAFVFIISFLGYCGAIKESRLLLMLYGVFIVLIFTMEIAAGTLAAVYRRETERQLKVYLTQTIKDHYTTMKQADAITLAWNSAMAEFSCCGIDRYTDFNEAPLWVNNKTAGQLVPEACCKLEDKVLMKPADPNCIFAPTPSNSYAEEGCWYKMNAFVEYNFEVLIGIGIGLGLSQLLIIFFAFCLCKAIEEDFIKY
ncbi:tetraspanin-18-like isoform X2 [Artemia franciscana]|uniref:tetraspanin-18-like isoform X2 n=1 Tax=Artemia franciscana TaxID=6661 RepID=UPI0032D9D6FB